MLIVATATLRVSLESNSQYLCSKILSFLEIKLNVILVSVPINLISDLKRIYDMQ